MGITTDFGNYPGNGCETTLVGNYTLNNSNEDTLWQHSDNKLAAGVLDNKGNYIDPNTFTNAEYLLATTDGTVLFKLNLGTGIFIEDDLFIINIDDAALSFTGVHEHQFRVYEGVDKLPPVWKRRVNVLGTLNDG